MLGPSLSHTHGTNDKGSERQIPGLRELCDLHKDPVVPVETWWKESRHGGGVVMKAMSLMRCEEQSEVKEITLPFISIQSHAEPCAGARLSPHVIETEGLVTGWMCCVDGSQAQPVNDRLSTWHSWALALFM